MIYYQNKNNYIKKLDAKVFLDYRGEIYHYNDFELSKFCRTYFIKNKNAVARAWQGHKKEFKCFLPIKGKVLLGLVEIDDFSSPSSELIPHKFVLDSANPSLIIASPGFANGIKSLTSGAIVQVFASLPLKNSLADKFRYDKNFWLDWNNFK